MCVGRHVTSSVNRDCTNANALLLQHSEARRRLTGGDLIAPDPSLHELGSEHLGHLESSSLARGIGKLSSGSSLHDTRDRGGVDDLSDRHERDDVEDERRVLRI